MINYNDYLLSYTYSDHAWLLPACLSRHHRFKSHSSHFLLSTQFFFFLITQSVSLVVYYLILLSCLKEKQLVNKAVLEI